MGRPDRLRLGELVCKLVVLLLCVCVLVMVAMDGVSLGPKGKASAGGFVGRSAGLSVTYPRDRPAGAKDVFRSSKRRIPKGPDPIHNRRAGTTGITPGRD